VELDPAADIVPNVGLGGLTLRTNLRDIQDLPQFVPMWSGTRYELVSAFDARYSLLGGVVTVCVDVRNGKIFQLIAGTNYEGRLFGQIYIGMSAAEALALDPRLYYDETEGSIRCRDVPGVVLDIPETDPPPELVPSMHISEISVYAAETDTLDGQEGNW
jgi:hypothetical protein